MSSEIEELAASIADADYLMRHETPPALRNPHPEQCSDSPRVICPDCGLSVDMVIFNARMHDHSCSRKLRK